MNTIPGTVPANLELEQKQESACPPWFIALVVATAFAIFWACGAFA